MNVKSNNTSKSIGDDAEQTAEKFLNKKKLKVIEKNYRCKLGEIDIIALDKNTIIFVEVRFRKSIAFGKPYETVNRTKQRKIINTAQNYLLSQPKLANKACRFDVISIHNQDIEWIQDAFDTTSL